MNKFALLFSLLMLVSAAELSADYRADIEALMNRVDQIAQNAEGLDDDARFDELVRLAYDYTMLNNPEFATFRGDPRGQDRWSDNSEAAFLRGQQEQDRFIAALDSLDRARLTGDRPFNLRLLSDSQKRDVEGRRFPSHYLPLNQMSGPQQDIARLMALTTPRTEQDYRNMVKRLESADRQIDDAISWMRKGLAAGVMPPKITLRDVPQQIRNQLVDDPADSPMLTAFKQLPDFIDPLQQDSLRQRAQAAYSDVIAPALERLLSFVEEEYIPGAREEVGLSALPDGEAWYAYNAKVMTTTDMDPVTIHEIGQNEVRRIRAEMDRVIESAGFEGSFEEWMEFLRTDPQFYHTTAEGLLREYRDISKRADPALMKVFNHLPRTPYGVIPVPSYAEKSQTTAYYQRGSVEAGRPGYFYANTYALDTRPRWEMEALTLHEAVPGHHLQLSIQAELEDVPWFRQIGGYTGFIEGWGLYSESLGEEMGFYTDPYSKFGQLTYEMWRAVRLVVDTGIHQLGWSRQQAIDFFKANAPKQEHDIIVEIDRYIVWPGQALAYKIGELKIKELRAFAANELGDAFDIRDFHDQVLGRGALPLSVLEDYIRKWVADQKAGS